jgi:hypothetical protein
MGERGNRSLDIVSRVVEGPLTLVKRNSVVILQRRSLAKEADLLDLRAQV